MKKSISPFLVSALIVFCVLLNTLNVANATTYYSRASGNWNAASSWSTVTYGDPTNTGTFPTIADIALVGDGHTITIVSATQCSGLTIGQGTSGVVDYPAWGTLTLTVSGTLTLNTGGKLWYNGNNTRTHNLFVSGNITNNGDIDLYADANDVVNLIFNGAASGVISGAGTFAFNLVTVSKSSRTYSLNVQSAAFLAAASPGTTFPKIDLVKGTFVCNAGAVTTWSDPVATSYTLPMDMILEVRSGTLQMLTAGDTLINSGKIFITGGRMEVGSTTGKQGIMCKDAGSIDPEVEISAGTLFCYGGMAPYPGGNPFVFKMSGGTIDLNSGTSGTPSIVLNVANIAGSQFVMTSGNIYIRKPSTTVANVELDFGSSNVYHNVTDGHIYFGDATSSYTFDYMPYVSYTYPSFEVAGVAGTMLKPSTAINSRMLSLKIRMGNIFDVSCAGTNATSTQVILTSTLDAMYAFYNDGIFYERIGQLVFGGVIPQYFYSVAGEYTVYNLTVNNAAGLYLDMPMTITNSVTFTNGKIYTSGINLLTFNAGTTVIGVSNNSYVDGPVKKIGNNAFTFPVGKNSMYRSISISAPSVATDEFTAEYFFTDPDPLYNRASHVITLDHICKTEYWNLMCDAGASSVFVTLSWSTSSGGVDDLPNLKVAQWDGISWQDQGNGGTTGTLAAGTIVNAGATNAFGPFTLASASSNNPLPIELGFFNANAKSDDNEINWLTISEKNNDYFLIERTFDGENFEKIARVKGAGNSTVPLYYQVRDTTPLKQVCYRLKQVDINGSFTYSGVVCVNRNAKLMVDNPLIIQQGIITVDFGATVFNEATFQVSNIDGRIIYQQTIHESIRSFRNTDIGLGENNFYLITLVTDNNKKYSKKLVVL